jgi:rubrerythrin
LIAAGQRASTYYICPKCGNRLSGKETKLCPTCRVNLESYTKASAL